MKYYWLWLAEQRKALCGSIACNLPKLLLFETKRPANQATSRFGLVHPIGARRLTFRTHLLSLFLDPDWRDRVRYKKATVDIINFDPFPIYPPKYTIKACFLGSGQSHSLSFYYPPPPPIRPPFPSSHRSFPLSTTRIESWH
jgi:hypothetical protein